MVKYYSRYAHVLHFYKNMFTRTLKHCTLFPLDYIYNNCYFICDQLDRRRVAVQTRGCVGRVQCTCRNRKCTTTTSKNYVCFYNSCYITIQVLYSYYTCIINYFIRPLIILKSLILNSNIYQIIIF